MDESKLVKATEAPQEAPKQPEFATDEERDAAFVEALKNDPKFLETAGVDAVKSIGHVILNSLSAYEEATTNEEKAQIRLKAQRSFEDMNEIIRKIDPGMKRVSELKGEEYNKVLQAVMGMM